MILSFFLVSLQCVEPENAETVYRHARQLFLHGYLEKSQRESERGFQKFAGSNPEWASKFQLMEAQAMLWRGLYEEALRTLSTYRSTLGNVDGLIQRRTLESVAFAHMQQFSSANQRLTEAQNLCTSRTYASCGSIYTARGVLAIAQGHLVEAKEMFLASLSSARYSHDKWSEATALLNLGTTALQNEHYDEAVDWSRSALQAGIELGEENQAQAALGNLGWAYFRLGDVEKSLKLFLAAENGAAKLGNVSDSISWLTNVGYLYMDTSRIHLARKSYQQALEQARLINSKEYISNILTDLAQVAVADGNPDEADTYAKQALSMARQSGSRPDMLDATAIQVQAAALRADTSRAESLLRVVEGAPESQMSMKWASEHALAKLYERQGQLVQAQNTYKSALTTFEAARADVQHADLQLPFVANATGIYDDYIHFLVSQGKSEEALLAADQSRARTLAQGLSVGANQSSEGQSAKQSVKSAPMSPQAVARKAGATLLFYWLGEKQSYLWAITPEKTALFPLAPQAELTAHIERYRKALTGPEDPLEAANPDGLALYTMLVAPAAELLRKNPNRPVMILSDGELSQLNFETLLVAGAKPHYWIDDAVIVAAPSLAMLAAAKPSRMDSRTDSRAGGGRLLLMGDAISPADYAGLPHAASEIKRIERHFAARDQLVFTQAQATPAAYLSSNPSQFAYIHFVSHGVASRTDPLDSAIILSRASTAEDSFKLYAREVMQHPIDARLVTISACYGSGTRPYAGEGLVGLSWAFLRAGAHNAVGALWEASDESTPGLMDTFYQGLQDGQSPGAALRQAKLTLLHSRSVFRKPLYWAPFQMYTRL